MVIYPVDNAIHLFNNWAQDYNYSGERKLCSYGGNVARTNYVLDVKCLRLSTVENLFSCLFCLLLLLLLSLLSLLVLLFLTMVT